MEFDGAFRSAMVILKGYYVGENFSGYAPFHSDLTDFLNYGGKNALTVRVDTTLGEGWLHEGAGIYRHVWLTKTAPMHVAQWGLCSVTSSRSRRGDHHSDRSGKR